MSQPVEEERLTDVSPHPASIPQHPQQPSQVDVSPQTPQQIKFDLQSAKPLFDDDDDDDNTISAENKSLDNLYQQYIEDFLSPSSEAAAAAADVLQTRPPSDVSRTWSSPGAPPCSEIRQNPPPNPALRPSSFADVSALRQNPHTNRYWLYKDAASKQSARAQPIQPGCWPVPASAAVDNQQLVRTKLPYYDVTHPGSLAMSACQRSQPCRFSSPFSAAANFRPAVSNHVVRDDKSAVFAQHLGFQNGSFCDGLSGNELQIQAAKYFGQWPAYQSALNAFQPAVQIMSHNMASSANTVAKPAMQKQASTDEPSDHLDPGVKRYRTVFSSQQLIGLERQFRATDYLGRTPRVQLATTLGLTERQIKIWFQNRRMKQKKERQYQARIQLQEQKRKDCAEQFLKAESPQSSSTENIGNIQNNVVNHISSSIPSPTEVAHDVISNTARPQKDPHLRVPRDTHRWLPTDQAASQFYSQFAQCIETANPDRKEPVNSANVYGDAEYPGWFPGQGGVSVPGQMFSGRNNSELEWYQQTHPYQLQNTHHQQ